MECLELPYDPGYCTRRFSLENGMLNGMSCNAASCDRGYYTRRLSLESGCSGAYLRSWILFQMVSLENEMLRSLSCDPGYCTRRLSLENGMLRVCPTILDTVPDGRLRDLSCDPV